LTTPRLASTTTSYERPLGSSLSLVKVSNPDIRILALKKAENSDAVIVRMVEQDGNLERKACR